MTNSKSAEAPPREVAVDWEALEDAFENNAQEVHSYLHLNSGEVLRVVDGVADPDMHSRISADTQYLRIESVSSREQYRWMERFIQMVEHPGLRGALGQAIDGKGAFRRFKDVLMSYATERERWFAFRSERLRVFMEAWLAAHGIVPVRRPEWRAEAAPATAEVVAAKRTRNIEALRRQLREVTDGLGARDLDKVLAFADFIKARSDARSQNREASSALGHAPPEPPSVPMQEEEAPSSEPRKVTVLR
ncbi:MAG TPA: UPF0158 family protein [Polyangiaceae bacterium]|jgi:hypothetical protein|nr:UPF0158 family protein [Polyangiaceae bacterium]